MLPALNFEEDEGGELIWESASRKVSLPPLGRIFSTIFVAEFRDVEKSLSPENVRAHQGSVGRAVRALLQHVESGLQASTAMNHIYIPMLEHAVKSKDHGNRRKIVCIFRWLFAKTNLVDPLAMNLASIGLTSQENHRVKLGWCVIVRELLENEALLYPFSSDVQMEKALMQINPPLMNFTKCVHPLVQFVCAESVKQGKQKAPTRLTMAAADFVTVFTKSLVSNLHLTSTQKAQESTVDKEEKTLITPVSLSTIDNNNGRKRIILIDDSDAETRTSGQTPQPDLKAKGARVLWDSLDDLILLVSELQEWNERGRPLHARGLQQVRKQLMSLARFRDTSHSQGQTYIAVGVSMLAASWRDFSSLILLEDRTLSSNPQPIIEHWLGALQYWTKSTQELEGNESQRADEMRGYALTCLALLIGRLDSHHLKVVLENVEQQLLQTLLQQVQGRDNENIDIAMAILRPLLFRKSAASSMLEDVVPLLMDLLDARDSTARAVVLLVAEYFASSPELEKVFARLDSKDSLQRRNGLDVLSELLSITTKFTDTVDSSLSQTIAIHLFDRLGDEELTNRVEASALFSKLDPSFTLPRLVHLVYSSDAQKRSAASSAVEAVLQGHSDQSHTVIVLLDCLRDLIAKSTSDTSASSICSKKGDSLDVDRVMRLIPAWASKVKDWEPLIELLLDKMYAEASNPVIPRFLSHISDQLSSMPNLVFPQVYKRMQEQQKMNEYLIKKVLEDEDALAELIFQRLSPMLVLRVLPLQAFNYSNCKELYDGLLSESNSGYAGVCDEKSREPALCITTLLLERMYGAWELDDVRKVASELSGRLLPDAMLPLVSAALEKAAASSNTVTAKSSLFSLCTSLMHWFVHHRDTTTIVREALSFFFFLSSSSVEITSNLQIRGRETLDHPTMKKVQQSLSGILLWSGGSSKVSKEISKAQHGCIDCFAAMICVEVGTVGTESQPLATPANGEKKMRKLIEEIPEGGLRSRPKDKQEVQKQWKILSNVIGCLTGDHPGIPFSALLTASKADKEACEVFRVCMANVLISASQKVSPSARPVFAQTVIPPLLKFIQVGSDSRLRAACLQVLFTSIYHLKGPAMLPFVADLLNLSISIIGGRYSTEERIAGTKVLASLLASDEDVLKEIVPFLQDAYRAVATVANMDSSPELRSLCEQLLSCMTNAQ